MADPFEEWNSEKSLRMRALIGAQVDQGIRTAIKACWFVLQPDKRNVDELEAQLRRHLDRAIAGIREDKSAFGLPNS